MQMQALAYGLIFGLYLATADHLAIRAGVRYKRKLGLGVWAGLVATPAVIAGFFSIPLLAFGLVFGAIFSFLIVVIQRLVDNHIAKNHPFEEDFNEVL